MNVSMEQFTNSSENYIIKEKTEEKKLEEIDEISDDFIFINENKLGVQKKDLKFSNYDDPFINPKDLINIDYKTTLNEFNNLIKSLNLLTYKYREFFNEKKSEIEKIFKNLIIYCDLGKISIAGLLRIIDFSLKIFNLKFLSNENTFEKNEMEKYINDNYPKISNEDYINNFLNKENLINPKTSDIEYYDEDNEYTIIVREKILIIKESEEKLFYYFYNNFDYNGKNNNNSSLSIPSITGFFFALKSMNLYILETITNIDNLTICLIKEIFLENLLSVKNINLY
jgi:hypothetical protein